ncbi:MAG: transcription antitermination factor NusB [Phycisphaerae bacterium]|nr:transcription antitermination factor NusB [Phycisphaerae bacterium]
MAINRNARHAALVTMYQLDVVADPDEASLSASVEEAPGSAADHRRGLEAGRAAFAVRDRADAALGPIAAEWPLHRQPVMDRNILRLAWWEMQEAGTPPALAINEAVDLAKEYGTDRSSAFVNGVLGAFLRGVREAVPAPAEA